MHVSVLLFLFGLGIVQSGRPLTPYQRSFTPVHNLTCAQCEMELNGKEDETMTFVEKDMRRRQCLDEPSKFFKPCPTDGSIATRGCAKLTTHMSQQIGMGKQYEVTLIRRFCASEGAEKEEVGCRTYASASGSAELCICSDTECNAGIPLTHSPLSAILVWSSLIPAVFHWAN